MRIARILSMAAVLLIITAGALPAGAEKAVDAKDDKAAVKRAVKGFYIALNAMFKGDVKPMKKVWSHAADVTYMGPDGGYLIGWEDTLKSWEQQASLKLGGRVKPDSFQFNIGEDIAVVHNFEHGKNYVDGKEWIVKIRATNVFRKENAEWKMIGHHVDLLPYLKKGK